MIFYAYLSLSCACRSVDFAYLHLVVCLHIVVAARQKQIDILWTSNRLQLLLEEAARTGVAGRDIDGTASSTSCFSDIFQPTINPSSFLPGGVNLAKVICTHRYFGSLWSHLPADSLTNASIGFVRACAKDCRNAACTCLAFIAPLNSGVPPAS